MQEARLEQPTPTAAGQVQRRDHRPRSWVTGALVAAAVLGATLVGRGLDLLPDLPFAQQTVDRSGPALMLALDDLAEYHAAQGTFQVTLDLERDTKWVPSVLSGERTTYLATGQVDGIVDFTALGADAVTASADRRSVTISLPKPRLGEATVDPENSRVVARDRGLLDRLGGAFVDSPTSERTLNIAAEQKLARAAAESDLLQRSEENTRALLTSLARSLGFAEVTVRFDATDGL
jgi:hypothetical protein